MPPRVLPVRAANELQLSQDRSEFRRTVEDNPDSIDTRNALQARAGCRGTRVDAFETLTRINSILSFTFTARDGYLVIWQFYIFLYCRNNS